MSEGLKFLVIAACVVVASASGWFAWQRYGESSGQQDIDQTRTYLFNRAGAAPGDTQRVDAFCKTTLQHVAENGTDNAFIKDDAEACRMLRLGQ